MKSRLLLTVSLLSSFAFVSCFPIPEDKPRKKAEGQAQTTITSEEQQQIEAQREMIKQRELEKQKEAETTASNDGSGAQTQTQNTTPTTPVTPTSDYPFANPVPGKAGFVFSPYNNKMVDVRDIPSGTLVRDPTYPEAEKKFFRVP